MAPERPADRTAVEAGTLVIAAVARLGDTLILATAGTDPAHAIRVGEVASAALPDLDVVVLSGVEAMAVYRPDSL